MLKRFVSKSDQKLCQKCKFMVFCLYGCDISRLRDRWHNCSKICNFRQFLAIYKSVDLVIKKYLFTSFKAPKSREGKSMASCYLFLNCKKDLMKFNSLIFMFFQFFILNDMNWQDFYNAFIYWELGFNEVDLFNVTAFQFLLIQIERIFQMPLLFTKN